MANGCSTSNQSSGNLLVFKGENYDRWYAYMKVIFIFQDVLEIVNDGFSALETNATKTQRVAHREMSKKDGKCMFLIHQCGESNIFEKIIEQKMAKEWLDTPKKCMMEM